MQRFQSAEGAQKMVFQPGVHLSPPPGGSKTPWTAAPELSEAVSARWPGQYSAYAKGTISLIAAVPHGQRCGPVRAYGRLAPSFPGRRIQGVLRTTAPRHPLSILLCFSHLKSPGASRGLGFAAGKNSAPRARRPQPRRNAGERPERKRHAMPPAEAWFGCGQRALTASDSFPSSKGNPLDTHAKVSIG